MSILDKHPAPWKLEYDQVVDGRPEDGTADCVIIRHCYGVIDEDAVRLLVAAPELLAELKTLLDVAEDEFESEFGGTSRKEPKQFNAARALIARIEGGNG